MGLFNIVNFPIKCPRCGSSISDFQTKDDACDTLYMETVDFRSVREFHTSCKNCDSWISVKLKESAIGKLTKNDYEIIATDL